MVTVNDQRGRRRRQARIEQRPGCRCSRHPIEMVVQSFAVHRNWIKITLWSHTVVVLGQCQHPNVTLSMRSQYHKNTTPIVSLLHNMPACKCKNPRQEGRSGCGTRMWLTEMEIWKSDWTLYVGIRNITITMEIHCVCGCGKAKLNLSDSSKSARMSGTC